MPLQLQTGSCSLTGPVRRKNEDTAEVVVRPGMTLCLVADGMGGQGGGDIASRQAARILTRELGRNLNGPTGPRDTQEVLRRALLRANDEILVMASLDRNLHRMGTTVVLALWRGGAGLHVAGLGDSRAYLARGQRIEQLTVDHSFAQALVEARTISAEEARRHPGRHSLFKHLGSKEVGTNVDVRALNLIPGDRVLLCTDGLYGVIADEDLLRYLRSEADPQVCAEKLAHDALEAGSRDNVTAVVIRVDETD